ncbi:MAG: hypothetical protein ACREP5_06995, partial [Candidatus Binatia bacterium]
VYNKGKAEVCHLSMLSKSSTGGGRGRPTETARGGITRGRKLVGLLPHLQHQNGQPEMQVCMPQPQV